MSVLDYDVRSLFLKAPVKSWRIAGGAFVVLLHALLLWIILKNPLSPASSPEVAEIHVAFIRASSDVAPPPPKLSEPLPPVLQPPDIVIEDDAAKSAPAGISAASILAPRPDPVHPNSAPSDLRTVADLKATPALVVKILVMPDGTVGDASVIKSSGKSEIDEAAIAYVKANWHFLPALLNGTPIQYWITLSVPLASH